MVEIIFTKLTRLLLEDIEVVGNSQFYFPTKFVKFHCVNKLVGMVSHATLDNVLRKIQLYVFSYGTDTYEYLYYTTCIIQ